MGPLPDRGSKLGMHSCILWHGASEGWRHEARQDAHPPTWASFCASMPCSATRTKVKPGLSAPTAWPRHCPTQTYTAAPCPPHCPLPTPLTCSHREPAAERAASAQPPGTAHSPGTALQEKGEDARRCILCGCCGGARARYPAAAAAVVLGARCWVLSRPPPPHGCISGERSVQGLEPIISPLHALTIRVSMEMQ